jgi:hypothetical protein
LLKIDRSDRLLDTVDFWTHQWCRHDQPHRFAATNIRFTPGMPMRVQMLHIA